MRVAYRIYGLRVEVDRPLSGAGPEIQGAAPPHVRASLSGQLPGALASLRDVSEIPRGDADPDEAVERWAADADGHTYLRLRYVIDGRHAEFVLDAAGARVWATWAPQVESDDVSSLLLGSVLGRVLRLRGVFSLHASVLGVRGRALAVVGSKGAGKSTTAAGLARAGLAVLADDIAALAGGEGRYAVQPGPRRLRLWYPAIQMFYGSRDDLPRVQSNRNKRFVDLVSASGAEPWRFEPEPLPLGAIYLLGARAPDAPPRVRPLAPADALVALVAHGYASHVLGPAARAEEFALLADLARHVPVRLVERPDAMDAVGQICTLIVQDFERV